MAVKSDRVWDLELCRRRLLEAINDPESGGPYLHHRIKALREVNVELEAMRGTEGAPIDEVAKARTARRAAIAQDSPPAVGG